MTKKKVAPKKSVKTEPAKFEGKYFSHLDEVLRQRYIADLRKDEIDKQERAQIIKRVVVENGWSQRELARQFGFAKSTVEDWLLWDDERVPQLILRGLSDTEIYKVLRNNRKKVEKKVTSVTGVTGVTGVSVVNVSKALDKQINDEKLRKMAAEVKSMVSQGIFSDDTLTLANEVINQCNRFTALIKRGGHKDRKKKK